MTYDILPKNISALILDMDGVLWRGDSPIGNLKEIFARIENRGLKYVLATNNATKTPRQYQEKLASFGAEVSEEHIITSSQAVAVLMKSRFPDGGPVFIIGETGLREALIAKGFRHSEDAPVAVVAGMDRELTYEKVRIAALFIRNGAQFFGTNPDKTFPTPQGLVPGAGATLALLETSTEVKPTIAGKPFPYMFTQAISRMGVIASNTLTVGDRFETDIEGGNNAGCRTALVLSGVTTLSDVQNSNLKPDFVAENLSELLG